MSFLRALFNSQSPEVDSLIAGFLMMAVGFVACAAWSDYLDPHVFNPLTYGTGAATLLAGLGGARKLRDGVQAGGAG